MRALPLAATALAAAFLLTACSDDGGDGGGKDTGTGTSAKAGAPCAIGEMGVRVGPANAAPAAGDTGNVPVTITNKTGVKCTLDGMPGVELSAGGTAATVAPDPAAEAQKTTLAKGASISFTLTYVRGETGGQGSLAATSAKFSLPGAPDTHDFTWSYGDVALKKDGKTPDATVSGFQESSD
ncbi:hypothetical protein DI272_25460 [Streptomyces sp. Act143]|uniref:DUF4232 domain-containing protein n=1 Tax=Streptomyces sp. Act143 TaxID=2200760 RepID=UPI000D67D7CB|nr:DUF4232 domain-containing protein [Streptomyces sp. Act143]PWI17131.1 hypothetical protein DI272_25460 [Streptomyces sp. Act143]